MLCTFDIQCGYHVWAIQGTFIRAAGLVFADPVSSHPAFIRPLALDSPHPLISPRRLFPKYSANRAPPPPGSLRWARLTQVTAMF